MPPAKWFKPVACVILLWMILGVAMLVMDLLTTPEQAAALPEAQRMLREERPLWFMVDFAIATGVGVLGAIALLMRRLVSVPLLTISLAAVTLQFGYTIIGMKAIERVGAAHAVVVPSFIFVMGALSLWVGIKARNEGWLD